MNIRWPPHHAAAAAVGISVSTDAREAVVVGAAWEGGGGGGGGAGGADERGVRARVRVPMSLGAAVHLGAELISVRNWCIRLHVSIGRVSFMPVHAARSSHLALAAAQRPPRLCFALLIAARACRADTCARAAHVRPACDFASVGTYAAGLAPQRALGPLSAGTLAEVGLTRRNERAAGTQLRSSGGTNAEGKGERANEERTTHQRKRGRGEGVRGCSRKYWCPRATARRVRAPRSALDAESDALASTVPRASYSHARLDAVGELGPPRTRGDPAPVRRVELEGEDDEGGGMKKKKEEKYAKKKEAHGASWSRNSASV
ncbi:hypothetical protein C8J57DRAFT_1575829 [Mycena rebaudengoi]|nr:hypothetical protein C8J57DRAFT_1575829 [Mycena rebaudengoi]